MNKSQKKVIAVATIMFIVMGLFPPWKQYGELLSFEFFGNSHEYGMQIDFSRLLLEWFIVCVAATVGVFVTKSYKPYTQKIVISVATVIFIVMGLFPPWKQYGELLTFSFLGYPPEFGAYVDFSRLLLEWFFVGVAATVAFFLTKTDKP